jgi:hypothetical protein
MLRPGLLLRKGAARSSVVLLPPTTNIDFTGVGALADLPVGSTFTRASTATRVNYRGTTEEVAANAMRPTYNPSLVYNLILNPWSDGSPPTGWTPTGNVGVTVAWLSSGVRDGIHYSRWRVTGTASGTTVSVVRMNVPADIPAVLGDVFNAEVRFEKVRDAGANNPTFQLRITERTLGGTTLASSGINIANTTTFASPPHRHTRTTNNASVQCVVFDLQMVPAAGHVYDFDIDIGFPVAASGAAYLTDSVPVATLAARKNAIPQYGLQGLLLEEAASNVLVNARDLSVWTVSNLTATASAASAPNGASEATRFTDNVTNAAHTAAHAALAAVAAALEVWTISVFVKAETLAFVQLAYSSGNFGPDAWANFNLTTGVVSRLGPAAQAGIVRYANGWFRISCTAVSTASTTSMPVLIPIPTDQSGRAPAYAGTSQSFLAWGAQFEKNPFPTSVTLPAVGTPAASTRVREELTLPVALIDKDTGSMAFRYAPSRNGGTGEWPASRPTFFAGNGLSNCIRWILSTSRTPQFNIRSSAVHEMLSGGAGVIPEATGSSMCAAWGGGSGHVSFAGAAPVVDTAVIPPVGAPTVIRVNGGETIAIPGPNIIVQWIKLWTGTKLTAAQVQRESTKTS